LYISTDVMCVYAFPVMLAFVEHKSMLTYLLNCNTDFTYVQTKHIAYWAGFMQMRHVRLDIATHFYRLPFFSHKFFYLLNM